ncbi:MAG: thermonuclease family protein [Acidobacteria bacterium]|nr:MAG: thermonuclease family protein [Acidobacteriota bacterium]
MPSANSRYSKPFPVNTRNKLRPGRAERSKVVCKAPVAIVVLLLAQLVCAGEVFDARCVGVSDGDTLTVLRGKRQVKIRLEGIDCPELHQSFGTRARQFTSSLVFGKKVTVDAKYRDRIGRTVSRVRVNGKDASLALVEAGLAWHYRRYSSDPLLARAEAHARREKKGLWSVPNPVPPWEWRQPKRRQPAEPLTAIGARISRFLSRRD